VSERDVVEVERELEGLAIIGMSGRFPGASDIATFWRNLVEGKDTISRFAVENVEALTSASSETDYVAARGVLEDVGMFDAEYFGVSPHDADRMDPQHRILLEACSNALEDAGYVSSEYAGEIGLFAGCSLNTYLLANLAKDREFLDELTASYQVGQFPVALGNDKDFLTTRVAYKLNLRGPVMTVQSACATSLVAISQAAQALMNYQCDMALAGGVSVTFPQMRGHLYQDGGIVSSDGRCRPFDAEATGTVFGHGVGVVVLKRLEDAVRDGDQVVAVLRGFAVNNDGSAKAGYMAPGVDGQSRVIAAAQAMAGISPDEISYVEAHGTGTPLGDPIEIAALTKVFRASTERSGFCTVGTAKGNVGHLDSAAGVTGVLKTALSLKHRVLPGLKNFTQANPNIDLAGSPFVFAGETAAWSGDAPLRAGVSAFGVGGVNAHVVLEEAPAQDASEASARTQQVFCASGRSEAAARRAAHNLAGFLEEHPETNLADAAFTLAVGRKAHEFRVAIAADDVNGVRNGFSKAKAVRIGSAKVAFQFSGQGTQFVGMGRELYETEPVYRGVIDECAAVLLPIVGRDLRELMFAAPEDEAAAEALEQTAMAQPALFCTELALAALWASWGVRPEAMVGHSLGEYVAATVAGVFDRDDALRLVALRGRMMGALPAGAMISVALPEAELAKYLSAEVSIAALNAARASVLSGTTAAIEELERRFASEDVASRRLRTSHAFHSAMMEPMLAEFEAELRKMLLHAPRVGFVSCVTGTWITAEQATSAEYWVKQCRQPVRFADALGTLVAGGSNVLLEVGPGETLTTLALGQRAGTAVASFGRPGQNKTVQDALAELWKAGVGVDWAAIYRNERRLRISLPTYPFERKLHWVEPPVMTDVRTAAKAVSGELLMQVLAENTHVTPAAKEERRMRLRSEIAQEFTALSGIETTAEEAEHQFLELGFDSLFLTQAAQAIGKKFKVKVTFRQLMEQFSTIAALADHLDGVLPVEAVAVAPVMVPVAASPMALVTHGSPIERLLAEQLSTLSQMFATQVEALKAAAGVSGSAAHVVRNDVGAIQKAPASVATPKVNATAEVRFGTIQPKAQHDLDEAQGRYIEELVARYQAMTPGSKRLTQAGRGQLADPRAVAGFRPQWKEMVYPLITERARGSRLWDVDGNEYIDIVNGYGCIMFGHSPEFVVEAARDQLDRGVAIGPQSPLAAEVAALMCELTGNERVTFCNTGSEAVMAAIRVARTVTGRDKIVYFAGDYHGTFDEVLVRATPRGTAPVAPGIPLENVTNVVVLEYGADSSLEWIRANAEEIAAVLVEPVQTRNPALQPAEFMREVRRITENTGSAMILDEVVTGFRLAQGGAQQFFGIRADMCTYGKVIGGGHPIGVLSGKATYLDALDGGAWQYGDDSVPEVGVTFFAGTFVRHPLALAAARSVLRHLKAAGPGLQEELNAKTKRLAESLNAFFLERGVPSQIHHFASWFYFTFPHDARLGSLLYYAMRAKGIHIQEGYPCFLTTAHTDADLAKVEKAFRETIVEMQEGKVLPRTIAPTVPAGTAMHEDALPETPERVPLSEPQREIFLSAALNDEANCAFNESLTLTLHGPVKTDVLAAALDKVFARHDGLRATVSADGEWLQMADKPGFEAEFVDLRMLDRAGQQEILEDAVECEGREPFDLMHGPLVRATCFQRSDEELALLLTAHHIVLDGWSANQLLEEVGRIYSYGDGAQLGPLLPFSSYAVLEKNREDAGEFADNERYWVEKFAGRSPRLDLPTDRPRPLEKSYKGKTFAGSIGSELYADLKRASAAAGCSLYVMMLSGFQILMHRLTGQDEVVVGISTAGQALYQGASLVGHCVHFLPMLSDLTENMTAREHLRVTRTALLDAHDHQEFTYGSLLRKLKLEREPGRLPLIEVQFNLEKVGANVAFAGLKAEIKSNPKQFVNTDLFLNVMELSNGLEFTCDFNSDLFDDVTLARWMSEWEQLLRSIAAAPETAANQLPMLGEAERERVLLDGNRTGVDFGTFEPMHASFLRIARETPHKVALECRGVAWSYGRLAEYASLLAGRVVAEGIAPGDLVAICVERSAEMVGAMLAVMMAGAAYVPLDPRHPRERTATVLENAGVGLLLVSGEFDLETNARILNIRTPDILTKPAPLPEVAMNSLAYVIYTSGSTGAPKGVAIEHGALVNLLRSMQRRPGLLEKDTMVAITTPSFDIAALELFLPLMMGARLVVATDAEVMDGRLLLGLIEKTGATMLQATPGAWRILIDAGWTGATPLKVLCGGEALPRDLADMLLDRSSEVWNMYGPTETTIWSSATRVVRGTGSVRVGPPIANTQFYVLDKYLNPSPMGVTGELYIGGAGLARGYWKRPDLTEEKFVANPFGVGRIYATGDLARLHRDSSAELLGRKDFQVKVRGYRIELAEIEGAIAMHPLVSEAVVMQQKSGKTGANRLIAYAATGFNGDDARALPLTRELPQMLGRTLPEYMIPAGFVVLETLPRTANGKVDRKALPTSEEIAREVVEFAPAVTLEQEVLAGIWAELLELEAVSIRESIFELGADSLLVFRMAARAQQRGLPVTATLIFQQRTIEGICAALEFGTTLATPQRTSTRIAAASRDNYRVQKVKADATIH
jgi:amino acid adenylation domain-containing protein